MTELSSVQAPTGADGSNIDALLSQIKSDKGVNLITATKEYLDFVLEQLSGLDEISSRAMMGEFILYYRGKVFGGIYDDRLLVKPVPVAVKMMPDAEMEPPYDGAKK